MKKINIICIGMIMFLLCSVCAFADSITSCVPEKENLVSYDFNMSVSDGENVTVDNLNGWSTYNSDGVNQYVRFNKNADRKSIGYGIDIYNNADKDPVQFNYGLSGNQNNFSLNQCYKITFYAKALTGTSYFKIKDLKTYDVYYQKEIISDTWKQYTLTIGPKGMNDMVDFVYPVGCSGDFQLQISTAQTDSTSEVYVDDLSIDKVSYLSSNFDWGENDGQDLTKETCYNWESYRTDGDTRYVRLKKAADRQGNGYGVDVYNKNSMNFVQFNHNTWVGSETINNTKCYRITFYAKLISGNADFRVIDIRDYEADYSIKLDSYSWKKYSFIMGPDEVSELIDFKYPSNHSGNFQLQFLPNGLANETIEFYVDDFNIEKVEFESGEFKVNSVQALYSNSEMIGESLENETNIITYADVSNNTNESREAVIVMARYDRKSNKLLDISIGEEYCFEANQTGLLSASMEMPVDEDLKKQKLKIYIFDSLSSLYPLSAVTQYPNREVNIISVNDVNLNYMAGAEYTGDFYAEPMYELGLPYEFYPW